MRIRAIYNLSWIISGVFLAGLLVALAGCRKATTAAATADAGGDGGSVWSSVAAPPIAAPPAPEPHTDWRAAIFVRNRTELSEKEAKDLEDYLAGPLAEQKHFSIASQEDTNKAASGQKTRLDDLLENESSALGLARNMDVDWLLIPSIVNYGHETTTYELNGQKIVNTLYKLRVTYKILDVTIGGSRGGATVEVSKTVPQLDKFTSSSDTIADDLLSEAAQKIISGISKPAGVPPPTTVPLTIICGFSDLAVPNIVNDNGTYRITESKIPVRLGSVNVVLDGVVLGTAPGTWYVPRGLHKLRLSCKGFEDFESTIKVTEGSQPFREDMVPSAGVWDRLQQQARDLQSLKSGEKLSDAELEVAKGFTKTLEQSGFKVDIKSDLKGLIQPKIFGK